MEKVVPSGPADAKPRKGVFISFEGIEGTGKTTQAKILAERLSGEGLRVVLTREPGGTVIGGRIREILLLPEHKEMSHITELLLYNAARAQHLAEVILPSVGDGKVVITDRFTDSTIAYQGYARGLDLGLLGALDRIATGGARPDLTILFDLEAEEGLRRNRGVNKVDRFELEDIEFHRKVREGFLKLAGAEPERIKIVDASLPPEEVGKRIWEIVKQSVWL
ncbi:MAG TPA: dTMP kinase [Dissulfurispiraceae bacterium]